MKAQRRDWYTPQEAAVVLGVDDSTLRRWIRQGLVKADRTLGGGALRIPPAEMERVREAMGA